MEVWESYILWPVPSSRLQTSMNKVQPLSTVGLKMGYPILASLLFSLFVCSLHHWFLTAESEEMQDKGWW